MKMNLIPILIAAMAFFSCGGKEPSQIPEKTPADPTNLVVTLIDETSAELKWSHSGEGVEGWWVFMTKGNESVSPSQRLV